MTREADRTGDLAHAAELFNGANKLRDSLERLAYRRVAMRLIFLKFMSDAFAVHLTRLEVALAKMQTAENETTVRASSC